MPSPKQTLRCQACLSWATAAEACWENGQQLDLSVFWRRPLFSTPYSGKLRGMLWLLVPGREAECKAKLDIQIHRRWYLWALCRERERTSSSFPVRLQNGSGPCWTGQSISSELSLGLLSNTAELTHQLTQRKALGQFH